MKNEVGKYLIDISKLIFAGVVLSVVIDISANKWYILILGIFATLLFVILGFNLIKSKK